MINVGLFIAVAVVAIYTILGPIVLFGIYAFLDRMTDNLDSEGPSGKQSPYDKDPALWSVAESRQFVKKLRALRALGSEKRM